MCNPMCLNYLVNYSHDHRMIEFSAKLCAPEIVSLPDYMDYSISIIQVLKYHQIYSFMFNNVCKDF